MPRSATSLLSSALLEAVFENWESEFLRWRPSSSTIARQKGPPSRSPRNPTRKTRPAPGKPPGPSAAGLDLAYENSLTSPSSFFLISFGLHAVGGAAEENRERAASRAADRLAYIGSSRFWFESLQNWQSEFLAVLAIVVLSIFSASPVQAREPHEDWRLIPK